MKNLFLKLTYSLFNGKTSSFQSFRCVLHKKTRADECWNEDDSEVCVCLADCWLAGWLDDWVVWAVFVAAAAVVGVIAY